MTLQFIFSAVTSFVCRVDRNVFHVLRSALKSRMRFAVLFFFPPCVPSEAPNGILVWGGRDKSETDCVYGPMPPSHFSFNLHQALFWGEAKN